ncbi:MAG: hypothetical protein BIFFINMI_01189 [Phycisphaerae bacterium]|nr:hypothetical protein [Phycisphaerae bacterium]
MSLDRSLKSKNALQRHRNVLSRAERLDKLKEEERWDQASGSVFGLPKVEHRKVVTKKEPAKAEEAAAGAEGAVPADGAAAPAAGAPAAAPADAAKGKDAAKGGKEAKAGKGK